MKGGVSAQVTAIEIERPDGQTKKFVVRRHGEVDLKQRPQVAADEFRLLHLLQSARLATPAPYYLGQSGEIFAKPYVVLEYIEGEPEFAPSRLNDFLLQLATHLSRIHSVDCSSLDFSFLPRQEERYIALLERWTTTTSRSLSEDRILDALKLVWPLSHQNQPVLLHGDFWPGNVLWKDGRLVGVIDWEDAALGDPLADLANSRLEMLWTFGIDAMHRFTQHYQAMTTIDCTNLPYWDLCAALRPASKFAGWALDEMTEKAMKEGHRLFTLQALEAISAPEKS
ncbi:MAG: phosphotransferase family protein [Dehalococcoidia bacterium]